MKTRHPRKQAIALEYGGEREERARVAATGIGAVAETIIDIAQQHEIPIHVDKAFAATLSATKLGEYVSKETTMIVAEILCFLYEAEKNRNQKSA